MFVIWFSQHAKVIIWSLHTIYFLYICLIFIIQPLYTDISVSLGVMTLSGLKTELTCCNQDQNISQCIFYAEERNIGQQNSSDHCCKLTVSREELLKGKAGEELRTTIIVRCMSEPHNKTSQDVTVTVWRLCKLHFNHFLYN